MIRCSHVLVYFASIFGAVNGYAAPADDAETTFAVGPAVVSGALEMKGRTAQSALRIDALPGLAMQFDYWGSGDIGFQGSFFSGFGADMATEGGGLIPMNLHQFDLRGRYRWSLSKSDTPPRIIAGLGVRSTMQLAHDQTPAILLDRFILGPQLTGAMELPLWRDKILTTIGLRVGLPFFVRESPADSGDPQQFIHLGSAAQIRFIIDQKWSIPLNIDFFLQEETFSGDATRASGTSSVVTKESLTTVSLNLAFAP